MLTKTQRSETPSYVFDSEERRLQFDLRSLWAYRELIYLMTWRDVTVRYKQTAFGILWAVLQPLWSMVIFSVIFGNIIGVDTGDVPYPVFSFVALLPWNYFSRGFVGSVGSLVASKGMLTKIYFPRLIIPLITVLTPIVDFLLAFVILLGMMVWYDITPTWKIITLPIFLTLAGATAMSIGLWLSVLYVRYRDINHLTSILVQFLMYASPIIYPIDLVPEKWLWLYNLNPMTVVIQGFRWALLDQAPVQLESVLVSLIVVLVLLAGGTFYFTRAQETFADVI